MIGWYVYNLFKTIVTTNQKHTLLVQILWKLYVKPPKRVIIHNIATPTKRTVVKASTVNLWKRLYHKSVVHY